MAQWPSAGFVPGYSGGTATVLPSSLLNPERYPDGKILQGQRLLVNFNRLRGFWGNLRPTLSLFQARRGGVGQLIRPAIAAVVIERRVAKAHAGLFMAEVNTPEAAGGQIIGPGKGQPVFSGPKFL
jgi:hypothetical protein